MYQSSWKEKYSTVVFFGITIPLTTMHPSFHCLWLTLLSLSGVLGDFLGPSYPAPVDLSSSKSCQLDIACSSHFVLAVPNGV
jgi:hypothetical protein